VIEELKVNKGCITVLPIGEPVKIEGATVTFIDANQYKIIIISNCSCPGAVVIIFELRNGQKYLHCGDFRANTDLICHPLLIRNKFDAVFIDTTYCDPEYCLPEQNEVINAVSNYIHQSVFPHAKADEDISDSYLVIVGTYKIGKERIVTGICDILDSKLFVSAEKLKIIKCLQDDKLLQRIDRDPLKCSVHMISMLHLGKEVSL
jgi:DNA cross-link repair 1A protein